MLALAAGFRSTALAISTVLALIFVSALFGGFLPAFIQKNVIAYLPNDPIDSIANSGEPALAVAIVAVIAWSAGLLAVATGALTRRDA